MRIASFAVLAILFAFAADAAAADTLEFQICGSPPHQSLCLGRVNAPAKFKPAIEAGGRLAIDAIMDDRLLAELRAFKEQQTSADRHAAAWRDVDPASAIIAMRRDVGGISVSTYGGLFGWLIHAFAGNVAREPKDGGPIRLNRAALPRRAGSIANTIVHELAHKAGLAHPSSGSDMATALCEPPYVIGSLVERRIEGAAWVPRGHCPLIASLPTGAS